jgi:hypothetical protein
LPFIESDHGRAFIERSWGRPWQETLRQWAEAQYVYLDWAEQARSLPKAIV